MNLIQAIRKNPYDPNKGNLSAYCRYLRYNVDDFYTKTNDEVKAIFENYTESKDNCNTCKHYKPDNPYCECCFNLDKYEKER